MGQYICLAENNINPRHIIVLYVILFILHIVLSPKTICGYSCEYVE